jgi:hypothetical protein
MLGLMIVSLVAGCETGNGKGTAGNNSSSAMTAAASGDSMTPAKPITPEQRRADPVYGYVDSVRKDLSDGKVQLINQVMRLSPEESAKFWPIYHDYEDELFALGDQRVEMTKKFAQSYATRSLDDASAAALANDWFKFENQRLDLLHK